MGAEPSSNGGKNENADKQKPGKGIASDNGVTATIRPGAIVATQAGGPPAQSLPSDVSHTGVADQAFGQGLPANVNK